MDPGFAPGYDAIIDACDRLHFRMPALRARHPDDAELLAVWLPQADAIARHAIELDANYDDRTVFLFVVDRCDEMLESVGLPARGVLGYSASRLPHYRWLGAELKRA